MAKERVKVTLRLELEGWAETAGDCPVDLDFIREIVSQRITKADFGATSGTGEPRVLDLVPLKTNIRAEFPDRANPPPVRTARQLRFARLIEVAAKVAEVGHTRIEEAEDLHDGEHRFVLALARRMRAGR